MDLPLPEDVLADVLRRLPPRSLAFSRCVCKAWRAVVDGRRLLRADLLPHSVRGIFLMYHDLEFPAFLSSPSKQPVMIFDKLDLDRLRPDPYMQSFAKVLDHRNGLLLYQDRRGMHVANPATQRRAQLPTPPRFGGTFFSSVGNLLFDPTESPHYEVLLVPVDRRTEETEKEMRHQAMDKSEEWPALTWVLCVFSSRTGQWEERSFVREGDSVRTSDVGHDLLWRASSAYWRGAFFVQCNDGSAVLRISLSNDTYRVIELPADIGEIKYNKPYLGQSKHGVCCALFDGWFSCKFRVWILDESSGKTGWVLKHHIDIEHNVSRVRLTPTSPCKFESQIHRCLSCTVLSLPFPILLLQQQQATAIPFCTWRQAHPRRAPSSPVPCPRAVLAEVTRALPTRRARRARLAASEPPHAAVAPPCTRTLASARPAAPAASRGAPASPPPASPSTAQGNAPRPLPPCAPAGATPRARGLRAPGRRSPSAAPRPARPRPPLPLLRAPAAEGSARDGGAGGRLPQARRGLKCAPPPSLPARRRFL
ncbi:hypothetical protein EJB05_04804, partial [Eragrostis curvula]